MTTVATSATLAAWMMIGLRHSGGHLHVATIR